jgi:DNA invertase Pin-like site-specific DNA recombinase
VRLIALEVGLDTATPSGRLALERRPPRDLPWAPTVVPDHDEAPEPEAGAEPETEVAPAPEVEMAPEREADAEPEPELAPAPEVEMAPEPEPEPAPEPEPEHAPKLAAETAPEPTDAAPKPSEEAPRREAVRALGYASVPASADAEGHEIADQRRAIEQSCELQGFELVELIGDREPKDGKALDRPGLSHAMQRIATGDASCLVVSGLDRLSRSVGELGTLVRWLERNDVRLVAVDLGLDTSTAGGRVTARALASVGDWERDRLSERTRTGLAAARAKRHGVSGSSEADWAALRKRIAAMRADGMTLQAIADTLNEEGVPTQRGGVKWRPSSVQTAAGYKRRTRSKSLGDLPEVNPPGKTGTETGGDTGRPERS